MNIDMNLIPESLHELVPWLKKWSIDLPEKQDEFVEQMEQKNPEKIRQFNHIIDKHRYDIIAWSKSLKFLDKNVTKISESEMNHPYFYFLNLLNIRELTGTEDYEKTPEYYQGLERFQQEKGNYLYQEDLEKADLAFSKKDYKTYVELSEKHLEKLTATQKRKLNFSFKKIQEQ